MNFGDIFAAVDDGNNFLCEPCAREEKVELESPDVNTFEVGSDGWLGPVMCKKCRRSIPVVCDGTPPPDDKNRYIICCDFDGVLHSYTSGWQGAAVINDPPVPGTFEWISSILNDESFQLCIYSSRSKEEGGIAAMQAWLLKHLDAWLRANGEGDDTVELWKSFFAKGIRFPEKKPAAAMTIDDRAFCFEGTFPTVEWLKAFRPWNKKK